MVEKGSHLLRLVTKEKYVNPKYRKQIEDWDEKQRIAKGSKIAGAMAEVEKGNLVKGLVQSLSIGRDIREEIEEGDTSSFPYLLILAIMVDIVDFIPVLGTIVQIVAWPILFYGTFMRGRLKYKTGIRMLFFVLNLLEIVPGVSWLPLESMSIIMLWRATAKARKEKEGEEEENDQITAGWKRKIRAHDNSSRLLQNKAVHLMSNKRSQQESDQSQPSDSLAFKEAA